MVDRLDTPCVQTNESLDEEVKCQDTGTTRSPSLESGDSGCVRDDVSALCHDLHRTRLRNGDDDKSENVDKTTRLICGSDMNKTHKLPLHEDHCPPGGKMNGECNSLPRIPRSKHCDTHRSGRGQFPGRCMKFIQSHPPLESCDETRQMPEVHEQYQCNVHESNTSSNAGDDNDLRERTKIRYRNGVDHTKQQRLSSIPQVVEECTTSEGRTSPVEDQVKQLPRRHRNSSQNIANKQSWLLRLFESKMFDMSIAITYLFNSKEPGVQSYLGKLITFKIIISSLSSFVILSTKTTLDVASHSSRVYLLNK